jgi:hypothetical protein
MQVDRYTKIVLTLIGTGLWVLTITQLGVPTSAATQAATTSEVVPATAGFQFARTSGMAPASPEPGASRGPTSTLPLRWRVAWAALETSGNYTYCSTAIAVTNTTGQSVNIEVEWMDRFGNSRGLRFRIAPSHQTQVWTVGGNGVAINNSPWAANDFLTVTDFLGYALVTASDPRIMVSAFQYCRTGTGYSGATVLSQTGIPAYPVGATAEYFQAGMPGGWPTAPATLAAPPDPD